MGEGDHRRHHACCALVLVDAFQQGSIELEHVDVEAVEAGERRIAGAEVIQRDRHADGPEIAERDEGALVVLEEGALGDLDLQIAGQELVTAQALRHRLEEAGVGELKARDVDGDRRNEEPALPPCLDLPARLLDHPAAERPDQPRLLRDGMNSAGGTAPSSGFDHRRRASRPATSPPEMRSFGW
jgi:hypothetical protein